MHKHDESNLDQKLGVRTGSGMMAPQGRQNGSPPPTKITRLVAMFAVLVY